MNSFVFLFINNKIIKNMLLVFLVLSSRSQPMRVEDDPCDVFMFKEDKLGLGLPICEDISD